MVVDLLGYSRFHIDFIISSHSSLKWRFTGVYGQPEQRLRATFWKFFSKLSHGLSWPWLCGGDLNEILFPSEKMGGVPRAKILMDNFREALSIAGLMDLGFTGPPFTWVKRNGEHGFLQEWLDRMLCNQSWRALFPNSYVRHLALWGSDHRPILTQVRRSCEGQYRVRPSPRFLFEVAWASKPECAELVKSGWVSQGGTDMHGISNRISCIGGNLRQWNGQVYRRTKEAIKI